MFFRQHNGKGFFFPPRKLMRSNELTDVFGGCYFPFLLSNHLVDFWCWWRSFVLIFLKYHNAQRWFFISAKSETVRKGPFLPKWWTLKFLDKKPSRPPSRPQYYRWLLFEKIAFRIFDRFEMRVDSEYFFFTASYIFHGFLFPFWLELEAFWRGIVEKGFYFSLCFSLSESES